MTQRSNTDIAMAIVSIALFSFLGWLIFTGINQLFPELSTLNPTLKVVVGFVGIFILVKIGIKKLR